MADCSADVVAILVAVVTLVAMPVADATSQN
jgi:hypothetical protein